MEKTNKNDLEKLMRLLDEYRRKKRKGMIQTLEKTTNYREFYKRIMNRFVIEKEKAEQVISSAYAHYFNMLRSRIIKKTEPEREREHIWKNSRIFIYGPSGTGKTTLLEIIAEEMNVPLIKIRPQNLENLENARRLVRSYGPMAQYAILLVDGFDSDDTRSNETRALTNLLQLIESPLLKYSFVVIEMSIEDAYEKARKEGAVGEARTRESIEKAGKEYIHNFFKRMPKDLRVQFYKKVEFRELTQKELYQVAKKYGDYLKACMEKEGIDIVFTKDFYDLLSAIPEPYGLHKMNLVFMSLYENILVNREKWFQKDSERHRITIDKDLMREIGLFGVR